MPADPERPIERRLRDYAARREADAGRDAFALHPVTRNALQVEVDRVYGRRARGGSAGRGGWAAWWPRLAFGGGALLVAGLLAVTFIPRASREELGDLARAEVAPAQTAAASGKGVAMTASALDRGDDPAAGATSGRRQEFQFFNRQEQTPSATETRAATAPNPPPARTVREATGRDQPPAPATAALLQGQFQVVLTDDQIALVDADQSSYSGRLEPVDPTSVGAAVVDRSLSFEERYYRFVQNGIEQVVPAAAQFVLNGTNRVTRLPVQIVGQMVARPQAVPAPTAGEAGAKPAEQGTGVYLELRATATMTGTPPVQIDARAQP